MTKTILLSLITCLTISAYCQESQIEESFKADFTKALGENFSKEQLDKMFIDYMQLLTPYSDVFHPDESSKQQQTPTFPLSAFKNQNLYTDNINNLLNSKNPNQRNLAYLVIASTGDTSKENILLDRIKTEKAEENLIWAGTSLLYMKCNHTTELFDFLVKNETFGDPHMLPGYILLDKDSLQQTAYNRINSEDEKAKILAAQILAVTPLNSKTENLIKQAVQTWDMDIKGYAIYSAKELQIGNLLQLLKPLLDDKRTRSISLEALANSPTKEDRNYLLELANKQDTISSEMLDCFYKSKDIENLKFWLGLLYTKQLPNKYVFFTFQQPLISSDYILADLQTALEKITHEHVLTALVRALKDRTDDKSIDIMISLLKHKSSTVRYWTARTLETNPSDRIKAADIKQLIEQDLKHDNP